MTIAGVAGRRRLPPPPPGHAGFTWYYDQPVPYQPTPAGLLAAAWQEPPLTAAGHAAAGGHLDEWIRDVPRSCSGNWTWEPCMRRYALTGHPGTGCPWHMYAGGAGYGI